SWPSGCPVQVHGRDHDPFFAGEGDLEAARAVQSEHPELEIVLHAGHGHLFTDSSTADYDESAAADVLARAGTFLAALAAGDPAATSSTTGKGVPRQARTPDSATPAGRAHPAKACSLVRALVAITEARISTAASSTASCSRGYGSSRSTMAPPPARIAYVP